MNKIKKLLIFGMAFIGTSCNSWLDIQPEDNIMEKELFESQDGFLMALNGIYLNMNSSYSYGGCLTSSVIDVMGQYYNCSSTDHSYHLFQSYSYEQSRVKEYFSSTWETTYKQLADLNAILEHCGDGNPVLSDLYYRLIKGEALGLRALFHFDLLRLFGPVWSEKEKESIPYMTSSDRSIQPLLRADSVAERVLNDLAAAADLLKDVDPVITEGGKNESGGISGNDLNYRIYRMNYFAVQALRARVYLWKQDYANAKKYAVETIEAVQNGDSPLFTLYFAGYASSAPKDMMYEPEILFSLYNSLRTNNVYKTYFTSDLNIYNLLIPQGDYQSGRVKNMYETENDYRLSIWEEKTKDNTNIVCMQKYADVTGSTDAEKLQVERYRYMIPLVRLSELYLIAAECIGLHEQNVAEAVEKYMNPLRLARNCIDLETNISTTTLNTHIMNEYIRDFIGEGQTFFYFKRNELENIPDGTQANQMMNMIQSNYVVPLPEKETSQRD